MPASLRYAMVLLAVLVAAPLRGEPTPAYQVVDTGQTHCFGDRGQIDCPAPGRPYSGQDGQYRGNVPAYRDNGDGTVTDLVTGLMWQKEPDYKLHDFDAAASYARSLRLGGHDDWRIPTIKELFSLADFRGNLGERRPYLDTKYFGFRYPDELGQNARLLDGQYWSSTEYVGQSLDLRLAFGFNFADGRIKGYPVGRKLNFIRCVRGPAYGVNDFHDNGDGTVTDRATGLTWAKSDSGRAMNWKDALAYARSARIGGRDDWRLPNVKELQSIVDYSRAPRAKDPSRRGPAIDPVFQVSDPDGWYWASTTMLENGEGYYVCFGRGLSAWKGRDGDKIDIHGAGAVRSDPKSGDPGRFSNGRGPQADEIRIDNSVRLVRGGAATPVPGDNDPVQVGSPGGRGPGQGPGMGPGMEQGQGPGMSPGMGRGPNGAGGQSGYGPGMGPGRGPGMSGRPGQGPGMSGPGGNPPGRENMGPPGQEGQDRQDYQVPPRSMRPGQGQMQGQEQQANQGQPGQGRRVGGRDFMSDHDANGDGRVSRGEFQGPPWMFDRLDKNGDGFITSDEAPKGPPPRQ